MSFSLERNALFLVLTPAKEVTL